MMRSLVATIKAGGEYVPIDEGYPEVDSTPPDLRIARRQALQAT